jgi:PhnB protein
MQLCAYLTFNGNCREAMSFYKDCLGGELAFRTVGDVPFSGKFPVEMKSVILHATLVSSKLILMATDIVSESGLKRGNNVSLVLKCSSEEQIRECFGRLSAGGEQTQPLVKTYWGDLFGDLVDKFGNQWLLHFSHRSS